MTRRAVIFNTEAELCAAFITSAQRTGEWTAYAETGGWDIVLVASDGTQIGVQAKLKFNVSVLAQAAEYANVERGPDFAAVLVPRYKGNHGLCRALGLVLIEGYESGYPPKYAFMPDVCRLDSWVCWPYRNHSKRIKLPAYVPDVAAGASGPAQLTQWKIAALQLVAVLELRGYVTRADFKRFGLDHRRWVAQWLLPKQNHPGAWVRGPEMPGFTEQHPVVYPQVCADVRDYALAS